MIKEQKASVELFLWASNSRTSVLEVLKRGTCFASNMNTALVEKVIIENKIEYLIFFKCMGPNTQSDLIDYVSDLTNKSYRSS